jgi:FMN phosphatase YigB (HAD superfamily)
VSPQWLGSPALPVRDLLYLVEDLLKDPRSRLQAVVAGWDHPVSREEVVLMDLFDLQHSSKAKRKPKPYPRPWPIAKKKYGGKKTVRRTAAEALAILRPQQ